MVSQIAPSVTRRVLPSIHPANCAPCFSTESFSNCHPDFSSIRSRSVTLELATNLIKTMDPTSSAATNGNGSLLPSSMAASSSTSGAAPGSIEAIKQAQQLRPEQITAQHTADAAHTLGGTDSSQQQDPLQTQNGAMQGLADMAATLKPAAETASVSATAEEATAPTIAAPSEPISARESYMRRIFCVDVHVLNAPLVFYLADTSGNPYDAAEEMDVGASAPSTKRGPEQIAVAAASETAPTNGSTASAPLAVQSELAGAQSEPSVSAVVVMGESRHPTSTRTADEQVSESSSAPGSSSAVSAAVTGAPPMAPPAAPSASSPSVSDAATSNGVRGDAEPPSKRQRTVSDYDPSIVIGSQAGEIKMTVGQIKFAQNVVKALKARNEAKAFIFPVNPVAMGIPNYPNVIKEPMDLGTVDIKLALTAAAAKGGNKPTEKVKLAPKWGLDLERDVYRTVEEFEREVRLTFQNCRTFNGAQHLISQSADALESTFDKQMKSLPSADAPPETPMEERSMSGILPLSNGLDGMGSPGGDHSRTFSHDSGRPKRDVGPPPPRDINYEEQALKNSKNKKKKTARASMTPAEAAHWDRVAREEIKFCSKLIDDLLKPANQDVAWVFYELPDKSYDFAPAYYQMIKRPVSLMQIQRKMKAAGYVDADDFDSDMQLLFKNCFTFNPPGSDVAIMGEKLKRVYEEKMSKRPEAKPFVDEYGNDSEEEDEASVLARALREQIALLEGQAADLESGKPTAKACAVAKATLSSLGALPDFVAPHPIHKKSGDAAKRRKSVGSMDGPSKKTKKVKKEGGHERKKSMGSNSNGGGGGGAPKQKKSSGGGGGSRSAAQESDDEDSVRIVTYEQKEELAAKITELPDERLEGALAIIAEDKPHSANEDEEIELDIDDLSPKTLYKLYRYVVRPKNKKTTNSNPAKNANDGRKRGTGGVKRKNLDESEESERIRRLQAQLQQFEGGAGGDGELLDTVPAVSVPLTSFLYPGTIGGHDDLVASESSGDEDDSDDSGSDY